MATSIQCLSTFLKRRRNCSEVQAAGEPVIQTSHYRFGGQEAGALLGALALLLTCNLGTSLAATVTATSCSFADVKSALDRASNGDTVLVPPGTCTWTSSLDFDTVITNGTNKYLTLQGAGIGQTIIIDSVSKAPYPNIPHLIRWTTVKGGLTRITGFTFQSGTTTDTSNKGILLIRGSSNLFRFDHVKMIPSQSSSALVFEGDVRGVVDHNEFDISAKRGFAIYTFHDSWNGIGAYGDNSWAVPHSLGTADALFIENNVFTNNQTVGFHYYAVDGWKGGRVVYRYNIFNNCTWANHGTESGGRHRGQRQFEIYNNTFNWNMQGNLFPSVIGSRGGVGVVFDNKVNISNGSIATVYDMQYYRSSTPYWPWGQCPSVWDQSSDRCLDQAGFGEGDLISGDTPSPQGWPRQKTDPNYIWNNTINGVVSTPVSNVPTVVKAGRDFFTLPRPGYTPYTYPHPLAIGTGSTNPPPAPPQNVTVR